MGTMRKKAIREGLEAACAGRILYDEPLARHTSMGVGGPADAMIFPADLEDLRRSVRYLREAGLPFAPIGNGTNLICRDGGYRGVIVALKDLRDLRLDRADTAAGQSAAGAQTANGAAAMDMGPDAPQAGAAFVTAGAGIALQELVALGLKESLAGIEFLAGIPGSVGGAVWMNAGAWGSEMANILTSVTWLTEEGEIREAPREAMNFSYRTLKMPAGAVICAARFSLQSGEKEKIRQAVDDILAKRQAKHPLSRRNAGSIFKNPRPIAAGRLIEAAGLKGTTVGQAKVSKLHANFIVNCGGATAGDVLALMDLVRERVLATAGIALEPEVKVIGDEKGASEGDHG